MGQFDVGIREVSFAPEKKTRKKSEQSDRLAPSRRLRVGNARKWTKQVNIGSTYGRPKALSPVSGFVCGSHTSWKSWTFRIGQ